MIRIRKGKIIKIKSAGAAIVEAVVETEGVESPAIAYPQLTGPVAEGDEVLLNTTAMSLGLGSGGLHFIMASLSSGGGGDVSTGEGHIIKLNYTPLQCRVLSVEEQDSPHHERMKAFDTLDGTPVLAGNLHSVVAPVCSALKVLCGDKARIAYVMTDASCLPIAFSKTVANLKDKGILAGTVTYGNSFGGDLEAVNKFSAIAAAREILGASVVIAAMGVGSIGTGTRYGYSGIEQGEILNAAAALGGTPVAIVRMSFADMRPRHHGISHHTLTALSRVAYVRSVVPVPVLDEAKAELVRSQLDALDIRDRHLVEEHEGEIALEAMKQFGLKVKTMGRGPEEDREFFLSCGAAARAVANRLD